jgi:aminopeptidase N
VLREEIGEGAYWKRLNDYRSAFISNEQAAAIPLAEAGQHRKVREIISRGKGPWLMCVLHHIMGKRMLPTLRVFFDRHRGQGATLEAFQAAMAEGTKADLSVFFEEWLWGTRSSDLLAQETSGPELAHQLAGQYTSPIKES